MEATCDISLKPYLTEAEACVFLSVSRSTLQELRISGTIGYCVEKKNKQRPGIRYRREHLLDYLKVAYKEVKPLKIRTNPDL
jgi:hypothetical protein